MEDKVRGLTPSSRNNRVGSTIALVLGQYGGHRNVTQRGSWDSAEFYLLTYLAICLLCSVVVCSKLQLLSTKESLGDIYVTHFGSQST